MIFSVKCLKRLISGRSVQFTSPILRIRRKWSGCVEFQQEHEQSMQLYRRLRRRNAWTVGAVLKVRAERRRCHLSRCKGKGVCVLRERQKEINWTIPFTDYDCKCDKGYVGNDCTK
ncbi:hypothetical protein Q1695_013157 [Nippostrongylus brasiliensis]|nr:hypothetical protein Q1695_013157 [Nippostrongylus brasiliensis]